VIRVGATVYVCDTDAEFEQFTRWTDYALIFVKESQRMLLRVDGQWIEFKGRRA
jgi:hypothetical protein